MTSAYQGCLHVSVKHRLGPECAQWKGKHFFFFKQEATVSSGPSRYFPHFSQFVGGRFEIYCFDSKDGSLNGQ